MEPTQKSLHIFESPAFESLTKQQISSYHSPFSSVSDSASPILAVAVLSVMGTVFLLLGYYIFISKCCSNWHHFSLLRRFSSFHSQQHEDPFIALSPTMWNRGLEQSMIGQIPTFRFEKDDEGSGLYGCVVCLSEFQENEMLRVLPKCSHTFHLDCIDVWLQSNSNCPLCRTSISGTTKPPIDHIVAPSSSPQNSQLLSNSLMGSDEDFVVIELGSEDEVVSSTGQQESTISREALVQQPRYHSPKKLENKVGKSKTRKCHHVSIMGDEGINVRAKDEQFFIQPIRRSFSMDSAADQQLYLTVQMIIHQDRQINESSSSSSAENDSRNRRSFFPFRSGRGFKNTILPLESDM
ncbi:RING-H2 finger protein ATL16-like [Cucurbita pepo subsp. pepo]|uniref:RING-H2 finger protein ATL16-like n=1 Tax=Cucurbita pepo subsp. pepo TaxID=3664 RepID=UPI000C9D76DB|nr:RING-H2 finger protein ATL16-like [Cucurbita pepo subsp. pepo]